MKSHVGLLAVVTILFLAFSIPSFTQEPDRTKLNQGKKATVFIEAGEKGSGSGFCIDAKGVFITNAHVVKDLKPEQMLKIIVDPATNDQKIYTARVIRTDEALDLAALRMEGPDAVFSTIELGDDSGLFETLEVTAFGFPFGKAIATQSAYPGVSVNVGRITALHKKLGKLDRIQLDAQVNPGNSGGPVVDDQGKVIGVVRSGIFGAAVNYAIPVRYLKTFLKAPDVKFTPPHFDATTRYQETLQPVSVLSMLTPLKEPRIELELTQAGRPTRKISAEKAAESGQFGLRFRPIEPPDPSAPVWLKGDVALKSAKISALILDQPFTIGDRELRLSDVSEVKLGSDPLVKLHDGADLLGELSGLEKLSLDLDEQPLAIEAKKVAKISLQKPDHSEPEVQYVLSVKDGAEEAARLTGSLDIDGSIFSAKPKPAQFKSLDDWVEFKNPRRTIPVPGKIEDVIIAGGGKQIVLHLKSIAIAAIYDVNRARIVKFLKLPSTECVLAAGERCLIVANPDDRRLERWSLVSYQKELAGSFEGNGRLKSMAMGSASNGPLMLFLANTPPPSEFRVIDPRTLGEIKIEGMSADGFDESTKIRASAIGDAFCLASKQGFASVRIKDAGFVLRRRHEPARYATPSYDGSLCFGGAQGVWSIDMESKAPLQEFGNPCTATACPSLYLSIPAELDDRARFAQQAGSAPVAKLYAVSDSTLIGELPKLTLGPPTGSAYSNVPEPIANLTIDKRVIFIPQAGQLVTVPFTDNELVVEPIELTSIVANGKSNRTLIISTPNRSAARGSQFVYQIKLISPASKPKFTVESGPTGMSVTPEGRVTWPIPEDHSQSTVRAIVAIHDGNGGIVYDTIAVDVL